MNPDSKPVIMPDATPADLLLQIEPDLGALFPRHVLDEQARNLAVRLASAGRFERRFSVES